MAKPAGYGTVTPWIIDRGVDGLIKFFEKAFDAIGIEGSGVYSQDGIIGHVEVTIGESIVMLFDSLPDWPDTPAFFRLYVEDADAVYQKSLVAGATSVTQVTELFWATESAGFEIRGATFGANISLAWFTLLDERVYLCDWLR